MYITYDNGLSLDIGWLREFEANGLFNIYIIENGNWETPMHLEKIEYKDFKTKILKLISFCEKLPNGTVLIESRNRPKIEISHVIQNGIQIDLNLGDNLDVILNQKNKKNTLVFSHEFSDGFLYFYKYNEIEYELIFDTSKVLSSIVLRIFDADLKYTIQGTDAEKIAFEKLIDFITINNISWEFLAKNIYYQIINIQLDNKLVLTYQFKANEFEKNNLVFITLKPFGMV